ncbi:hypothetical protein ES703_59533 [subsurface metagenome]
MVTGSLVQVPSVALPLASTVPASGPSPHKIWTISPGGNCETEKVTFSPMATIEGEAMSSGCPAAPMLTVRKSSSEKLTDIPSILHPYVPAGICAPAPRVSVTDSVSPEVRWTLVGERLLAFLIPGGPWKDRLTVPS